MGHRPFRCLFERRQSIPLRVIDPYTVSDGYSIQDRDPEPDAGRDQNCDAHCDQNRNPDPYGHSDSNSYDDTDSYRDSHRDAYCNQNRDPDAHGHRDPDRESLGDAGITGFRAFNAGWKIIDPDPSGPQCLRKRDTIVHRACA